MSDVKTARPSIPVTFGIADDWEDPERSQFRAIPGLPAGPVAAPVVYRNGSAGLHDAKVEAQRRAEEAEYERLWEETRCQKCRFFDRESAAARVATDVARKAMLVELQIKRKDFDLTTCGYCHANSTPSSPMFTTPDSSCDNFRRSDRLPPLRLTPR